MWPSYISIISFDHYNKLMKFDTLDTLTKSLERRGGRIVIQVHGACVQDAWPQSLYSEPHAQLIHNIYILNGGRSRGSGCLKPCRLDRITLGTRRARIISLTPCLPTALLQNEVFWNIQHSIGKPFSKKGGKGPSEIKDAAPTVSCNNCERMYNTKPPAWRDCFHTEDFQAAAMQLRIHVFLTQNMGNQNQKYAFWRPPLMPAHTPFPLKNIIYTRKIKLNTIR